MSSQAGLIRGNDCTVCAKVQVLGCQPAHPALHLQSPLGERGGGCVCMWGRKVLVDADVVPGVQSRDGRTEAFAGGQVEAAVGARPLQLCHVAPLEVHGKVEVALEPTISVLEHMHDPIVWLELRQDLCHPQAGPPSDMQDCTLIFGLPRALLVVLCWQDDMRISRSHGSCSKVILLLMQIHPECLRRAHN